MLGKEFNKRKYTDCASMRYNNEINMTGYFIYSSFFALRRISE